MDIGAVVDEYIDPADLEKFRKVYEEQSRRGLPSAIAQFSYAHALIKSMKEDVRTGIFLLEGLLSRDSEDIPRRDNVYFLAIAHTRLKEYDRALAYIELLLEAESDNRQALDLKALIDKRMKRGLLGGEFHGLLGMALIGIGGGAAVIAGIVAAGALALRKH